MVKLSARILAAAPGSCNVTKWRTFQSIPGVGTSDAGWGIATVISMRTRSGPSAAAAKAALAPQSWPITIAFSSPSAAIKARASRPSVSASNAPAVGISVGA